MNRDKQRQIHRNSLFLQAFVKRILFFLLVTVVVAPGCTQYSRLMKKGTPEEKYAAGLKYFEKKDYLRAAPIFEELIGTYRQKKEAQEVYLLYAYCQFYMDEYGSAAYHFKNFAETYSFHPKREEAAFMAAKCEYHRSLPHELDQTNTKNAIGRLQLFVNQYPDGKYVEECNQLMDELRHKLHEKTYRNAMLFLNIGDYKAAMVALSSGVSLYPDIPWKEEMTLAAVKAAFLYAENSVESMQPERYQKALDMLKSYQEEYRDSGELKNEAKRLEKKISDKITVNP